jgi:hypothetical protein
LHSTVAAGQPVDSNVDQLKFAASTPGRVDAGTGDCDDSLSKLQAPTRISAEGVSLWHKRKFLQRRDFLFKTTARPETPKGKSATPLTDRPVHPRRAVVHCLAQFSPWRCACSGGRVISDCKIRRRQMSYQSTSNILDLEMQARRPKKGGILPVL